MEWTDIGIVLGTRRHGETSAILELMTPSRGRHLGLVRGGAGARLKPVLQPGNTVSATWRARLDEHLGHYVIEGLNLRSASLIGHAHAVYGVTHIAGLCRLLPERDPHAAVYEALDAAVADLDDPLRLAVRIARFELQLLAELGFGLDLDECAASGVKDGLVYVSPRSGRAVSRDAGLPWQDRLLALPAFLGEDEVVDPPGLDEVAAAFALTGYFLDRRIYEPRGSAMPDARRSFIATILRRRDEVAATV